MTTVAPRAPWTTATWGAFAALVALAGLLSTQGASARDTVSAEMVRSVASRLDATYLDRGMPGLALDERACYAKAGTRGGGLKLCMLYDMSVQSLGAGVRSYFETRGGVNPDAPAAYQADQAFGARMRLDTYYAFGGSVAAATAYYGDAVTDVLQAVADQRQHLDTADLAP